MQNNWGRRPAFVQITPVSSRPTMSCPNWVVMIHGGPGGNKSGPGGLFIALAGWLASEGIASLRFDMLGCGESEGDYAQMTLADQGRQIAEMVAVVRESGCQRLGLLAESLGAASLLHYEGLAEADALALLWPAIDLYDSSLRSWLDNPDYLAQLRSQGHFLADGVRIGPGLWEEVMSPHRLEALRLRLRGLTVPTLLIHGEADSEVPFSQSQHVKQLLGGPTRLVPVPTGEHGLRRKTEQMLVGDEVAAWFGRYLDQRIKPGR